MGDSGGIVLLQEARARRFDCLGQSFAERSVPHWRDLLILHSVGENERASALLDDSENCPAGEDGAWFLMSSAAIFYAVGQKERGANLLRKGLALCRKNHLLENSFWKQPGIADLCLVALQQDVEIDLVRQVVRNNTLIPSKPPGDLATWPWPIRIFTLGRFSVSRNDEPLRFLHKAQKRPMELLQALVAMGGRAVSRIHLEDALWVNASGHSAHVSFNMTLHRLRKLIGHDSIVLEEGKLTINPRVCWVDVWAYERHLRRIEALLLENGHAQPELSRLVARLMELCQGPFLGREEEQPWMLPLREKLRHRMRRLCRDLGRYLGRQGRCEQALAVYRMALEVDPLAEEFYRQLMICFAVLGRDSEALVAYHNCRRNLQVHINAPPSVLTENVLKDLRQQDHRTLVSTFCSSCRSIS